MAGHRRLRNEVDGPVRRLGEELSNRHDEDGDQDADEAGVEEVVGVAHPAAGLEKSVDAHVLRHEIEADDRHGDRRQEPCVEGAHDPFRVVDADEERADDRADDAHRAEQERVHDPADLVFEKKRAQQHGGDHRHGVGLEEVGRHAGAVADVVSDVVRDDGRVPRIVLGYSRLDLSYQVCADVGGLGVDAAAQPGENRHQARAECEAHQGVGVLEDVIRGGDAEQAEADDHEPRHRATAERNLQRLVQPAASGLGRAQVGAD